MIDIFKKHDDENETKAEWMQRNKDIISACFDDGIVTETCRQCHKIHCTNYKKVQREIRIKRIRRKKQKLLLVERRKRQKRQVKKHLLKKKRRTSISLGAEKEVMLQR